MADKLTPEEKAHEARIDARAKRMWIADGSPAGQEAEFHERARELVGMEENPGTGLLPIPTPEPLEIETSMPKPGSAVIEEADIQDNLGEFPGPFTDQGDREQTPRRRHD